MTIVLLPVLAVVCLGALYGVNVALGLPAQAEEAFGPAAANLTSWQRLQLSALLLAEKDSLTTPSDPAGPAQAFVIELGESVPSITGRLWRAGLIPNPGAFRTYLQYAGLDTSLQAGEYSLSPAMSPLAIAQQLQDATPSEVPFGIFAGWRLEEIAATIPASGLELEPADFLAAARNPSTSIAAAHDLPAGASLEGFLFPGTYTLARGLSAPVIVRLFVENFDREVGDDTRAGFVRQGLSLYQAVILASIVEREAVQDEESPLIASVFLNRLAQGIKLDADPTVQYAVGFDASNQTWWVNPITLAHLQVDSPFNTYRNPGLPPGPIANPGIEALRAVAFPAQTPYYYFRAACDGSGLHQFAETFAEHQANACP